MKNGIHIPKYSLVIIIFKPREMIGKNEIIKCMRL